MLTFNNEFNFLPDEILVYLRKSRSDDPMLSVEEVLQRHETILDEWSENNLDTKIPEENKYREIVSGETIEARPEVQKLLRMIESPKYKAILVVEVQRLSRGDLEDAGRLIKLLRYTNTFVITPQKTYDLTNEYDRDIFERELKRGNEYLEYQKKIMGRGRLLSVSQGNYILSTPPYGYDIIWLTEGKKKYPTLKENKEQADVVRMIFDMYVNKDMSMYAIANHLNELGIKPAKSETWSRATMRDMIENVHYIGKVKWQWRKTITIVEDSEIKKTRPKARIGDYLVYDGKHEGIISEELFNAAIEKRGRNARVKPTHKVRNVFASLLYCHCGRAMTMQVHSDKNGFERCAPRLVCNNQMYCKTGSCLYDEIVVRISAVLKQHIEDFEFRLENGSNDSAVLHTKLIKNLEKRLETIQAKELAQWEAQADPDPSQRMPQDIFKMLNEKLQKEKQEIREALNNAYSSMPKTIDYEKKVAQFKEALAALNNPDVDAQEKNRLLKTCIERIEYKRDKPERLTRKTNKERKNSSSDGNTWTNPPINITVKLKV